MPEICIQRPAGEPVHLDEAKLHLRVTDTAQDSRIISLIAAARQAAETKTRQQLLHSRWQLTLDQFPMAGVGTLLPFGNSVNIPPYAVILPHAPLVQVMSVKYVDMSGTLQTMPASDYVVNKSNLPGLVTPGFGKIWPIVLPQIGSVTIAYNAGYASPFIVNHAVSASNLTVKGPVTWSVGDQVSFYNSGGVLPAPLDPDADYLIASVAGSTYTITDTSGTPIVFTADGTGKNFIGIVPDGLRNWILLRAASLYENREEVAILNRGKVEELPYVDSLLDPYRISMP